MTLFDLASLLDVEGNFAFLPHNRLIDGKPVSVTLCNCYAVAFCAAHGAFLPIDVANKQALFLVAHPDRWESVTKERALDLANSHELVLAVAEHAPHGHIAPLVESPSNDTSHVYVSAAGARNYRRARLESSFGFLQPSFFHWRKNVGPQ